MFSGPSARRLSLSVPLRTSLFRGAARESSAGIAYEGKGVTKTAVEVREDELVVRNSHVWRELQLILRQIKNHKLLFALLTFSWGLRIALAVQGGQLFWPDEKRYFRGLELYESLIKIDPRGALRALSHPDHIFFPLVACVPAAIHSLAVKLTGLNDSLWIGAAVLGLASVANISLVYALARRGGATGNEAFFAAFLMACANTMFYYSRHLLPYDASMVLALFALYVGIHKRTSALRSYLCGLVACMAFLIYFGSWPLATAVIFLHAISGETHLRDFVRRGLMCSLGFLLPFILISGSSLILRKSSQTPAALISGAIHFSNTAIQGDFAEGWSHPWEFLWHAEHLLLLVWAAGLALIVVRARKENKEAIRRGGMWSIGVTTIYLLLVLTSNILHKFVVYGRNDREMVPFLCLATACAFFSLPARLNMFVYSTSAVVLVQGAMSLAPSFMLKFPREIDQRVVHEYGSVRHETTIFDVRPQAYSDDDPGARYVLLNAQILYPIKGVNNPPPGRLIFRVPHPLKFIPYQYEGYAPPERRVLRTSDISVQLIETLEDPW